METIVGEEDESSEILMACMCVQYCMVGSVIVAFGRWEEGHGRTSRG